MPHDHAKLEAGGWQALRECLDAQVPLLAGFHVPLGGDEGLPPVMPRIDIPLVLEDEEQRSRGAVDVAVRQFADTGTWPQLSAWEGFFVRERMDFARVLLMTLTATHSASGLMLLSRPFADFTSSEVIEWLLIDTWLRTSQLVWVEAIKTRASEFQAGYEAGLNAASA